MRKRFAAGKNNALLQKQKAHFARARSKLQNSPGSQRTSRPGIARRPEASGVKEKRIPSRSHAYAGSMSHEYVIEGRGKQRELSQSLFPKKSPSIISISSGNSSSSALSSSDGRKPQQRPAGDRPSTNPIRPDIDEEQLLVAKRRRLLARKDWLGVSVARPLQMDFPSSRDKDRIGKRRKIEGSGRRSKAAVKRLLTPPFEERLPQPDALMSGALPAEDEPMRVKIGADAFASQTQRSRHSQALAATSMRPLSTDFGSISEESMLLGADGDDFEANQDVAGTAIRRLSLPPLSGLQSSGSGMSSINPRSDWPCTSPTQIRYSGIEGPETVHCPYEEFGMLTRQMPGRSRSPVGMFEHDDQGPPWRTETGADQITAHSQYDEHDPSSGDETWRRLMNIQKYTSSHTSMSAVRSSSLHNTTSASSHRPVLHPHVQGAGAVVGAVSTPRGFGTQGDTYPFTSAGGPFDSSAVMQSPQESLQQIIHLANLPAALQPTRLRTPDASSGDGEPLWKEFICGTDDESSESSQDLTAVQTGDAMNLGHVAGTIDVPATSPSAEGGPEASDTAAIGTSLLVAGSTPSVPTYSHDRRETAQVSMPRGKTTIQPRPRGSHAHAFSIESPVLQPIKHPQQRNIHGNSSAMPRNPRRFKMKEPSAHSRGEEEASPSFKSFKNHLRKKGGPKDRYSVYDLVDSDGISLS